MARSDWRRTNRMFVHLSSIAQTAGQISVGPPLHPYLHHHCLSCELPVTMEEETIDKSLIQVPIVVACTKLRRVETIEEMKERLKEDDADEAKTCSVWMERSDLSQPRECSHNICRRVLCNDEVR